MYSLIFVTSVIKKHEIIKTVVLIFSNNVIVIKKQLTVMKNQIKQT